MKDRTMIKKTTLWIAVTASMALSGCAVTKQEIDQMNIVKKTTKISTDIQTSWLKEMSKFPIQ